MHKQDEGASVNSSRRMTCAQIYTHTWCFSLCVSRRECRGRKAITVISRGRARVPPYPSPAWLPLLLMDHISEFPWHYVPHVRFKAESVSLPIETVQANLYDLSDNSPSSFAFFLSPFSFSSRSNTHIMCKQRWCCRNPSSPLHSCPSESRNFFLKDFILFCKHY